MLSSKSNKVKTGAQTAVVRWRRQNQSDKQVTRDETVFHKLLCCDNSEIAKLCHLQLAIMKSLLKPSVTNGTGSSTRNVPHSQQHHIMANIN
jgi:hypothetical protein